MKKVKDTPGLWSDGLTSEQLVSVSQLQTFLSCKKKWKYAYIDNITPRVDRAYLTVGKLCHKGMQVAMQALWRFPRCTFGQLLHVGLDAMYNEGEAYMDSTPLLTEELPEILKMRNDAADVFAQALVEFDPLKYEVASVVQHGELIPALELHFLIPCAGSTRMHGYIDAILMDRDTGMLWCVDYKFRKSLSPDDEEAFNLQNAVYTQACAKMKLDIVGTMTWQHVNTPAADPAILKDGNLSRAKIKTTWRHYSDFCEKMGKDPADYAEMEEKLSDIEWCRATLEYRNPQTVSRIWNDCVVPNVYEIQKARNPKLTLHRSMYPWNCKMCQFQSLCQGELRDYDVDKIIEREYTIRA